MDRKEARRKAQELVMKMTIEEKASQLTRYFQAWDSSIQLVE